MDVQTVLEPTRHHVLSHFGSQMQFELTVPSIDRGSTLSCDVRITVCQSASFWLGDSFAVTTDLGFHGAMFFTISFTDLNVSVGVVDFLWFDCLFLMHHRVI